MKKVIIGGVLLVAVIGSVYAGHKIYQKNTEPNINDKKLSYIVYESKITKNC